MERSQRKVQFAAIPDIYSSLTWDDFKIHVYSPGFNESIARDALESARSWVQNMPYNMAEGVGLYLFSRAKGSGKTMLACIIGNELISQGYSVLFATTLDILDKIKSTWNNNGENESAVLRKLTSAAVLILDDIGVEGSKDWIQERFYKIINDRYVNRKPVIYTSNLEMQYLKVDGRIINRMQETSFVVEFPNESLRIAAGSKLNATYAQKAREYMVRNN